ncbi:MAG: nicotinate-nucleotide adenylyltransferase [Pyrinomonadaceae bacterium]
MKKIAYYGGSFDPVHLGHLKIATELCSRFKLDEFNFVPAFHAPHKARLEPTSAFHRFAMLALATREFENIKVSTIEVESPEKPYTIETLTKILAANPSNESYFVMGADSWDEITTWREWQAVLTIVNVIVVTRPGFPIAFEHVTDEIRARIVDLRKGASPHGALPKPAVFITDFVQMDISSTEIRRSIRADEDIWDALVPPDVAGYINKNNIY